ncbi:MAG: hypothetical protein AB7O26_09030 [Planctomycetaceae bacterium]
MKNPFGRRNRGSKSLEDYAAFEYILLGDLGDLLEEPADKHTHRWLLAVLDALVDTIPREFQMKSREGYLSEVLNEYPSWYRHVEYLRAEHHELYANLRDLRGRIAAREEYEESADRVRIDLRDWMARLVAHHHHENRLVQTAINLEVGTGD